VARFPILTFHSIDTSGSVVSTSPVRLAEITRELVAAGWRLTTVSDALEAWRTAGSAARTVGVSFDDAYLNVVRDALPVLADAGCSATVFVIAGRVGGDNRWPGQPTSIPTMALAGWTDLERLVRAGWEIGSHTRNHSHLTALAPAEVEAELESARLMLTDRLGVDVPLLAYPYGGFDRKVREHAARVHAAACTTRLAMATDHDLAERFALPRIDAYYLRSVSASVLLGTARGRGYLAVRRLGRRLRRWMRNEGLYCAYGA